LSEVAFYLKMGALAGYEFAPVEARHLCWLLEGQPNFMMKSLNS
jgi:hypothetical protein